VSPVHEARVTIRNKLGLHARPAAQFVKLSSSFPCEVLLGRDDVEVNGKSIMGVMMLAAEQGATVTIRTMGPDGEAALRELVALVERGFDEDDEGRPMGRPGVSRARG
jgi:phosphocarrier protein HPr